MSVTWRTELHFTCDEEAYNPSCEGELMLDQLDAKTKKGMFRIAEREGWIRVGDKCYCPSCAEKQSAPVAEGI